MQLNPVLHRNARLIVNAIEEPDAGNDHRRLWYPRLEPVTLTGYIRFPETAGALTPAENVTKRLWFTRDHLAMAHALGWGEVAPFYVDLEAPAPANGIPKPGPLDVHLKDDHMQYAITWFALAGAVVIAFGVWLRAQRRVRVS